MSKYTPDEYMTFTKEDGSPHAVRYAAISSIEYEWVDGSAAAKCVVYVEDAEPGRLEFFVKESNFIDVIGTVVFQRQQAPQGRLPLSVAMKVR